MILDSLKNSALYYGVSPRMKQAFELIASTDWTTMEPGIHELDGKDIYVNVMERELKQKPDAKLEIHNEYIDIQVLIRGEEESFGWSERRELKKPLGEFSVENDNHAQFGTQFVKFLGIALLGCLPLQYSFSLIITGMA